MDDSIRGYEPLVESLARRFVGRNGAELDDLVQEGRVFVWQSLARGIQPVPAIIEGRMQSWTRLLGTQIGRGRGTDGEAVDYATLLPLDDFINVSHEFDISALDERA
jgi:hypothetical protein